MGQVEIGTVHLELSVPESDKEGKKELEVSNPYSRQELKKD